MSKKLIKKLKKDIKTWNFNIKAMENSIDDVKNTPRIEQLTKKVKKAKKKLLRLEIAEANNNKYL